METKKVTICDPVSVMGWTFIPIVEASLHHWSHNRNCAFSGIYQPIAVLMVSPSGKKVIRIDGEEVPIYQFLQEFPEIKESVEEI